MLINELGFKQENSKLTLKEKFFIFRYIFISELNIIKSNDIEFRCFLKATKIFIWLSILLLIINVLTVSVGYYL